ncbi:hypothetical protein [Yoonia sp.]|uniref:hypothetical protein n=1 Tax=Yoonia sp. TaxID=2212373 RepID=UPI0019DD7BDA|nr:hypothetical protein [Yoonia sp.]MBE0414489.1 hypothetical protein [Yoonia sp.]
MKTIARIIGVIFAMALAGCEDTDRYPLTDAECGPDDPVLQMGSGDCYVPPMIGGI